MLAALGGSAQRPARSRFPHSISAEEAIGSLQAQFGIAAHLRALHAPRHSPSRSPVRAAGPRPRRLPPTRSPTRSPTRLPLASRVAAQPAEPKSEAPAPEATTQVHGVFQRVRSASEIQADEAMAKIRSLQAGLFHRINSSSAVLKSAEKLIEECGQAILSWFGSLSGPALDAAIREAFERFDADRSGFIDRGEFAHAMHTMGMRLAPDQYDVLFKKCDVNKSGEIDLEEFTHMIRIHLKKACAEDCRTCEATGGSNQPDVVYRPRWVDDESLLSPAASKLQNGLVAALTRQDYAEFKDDPDDFWSDGSEDSGTGTGSVRRFRRSRRARTRTRESELEGVAGDSSTRKKHSQVRPYKPDRGIDSDLSFDEDDGLDSTTTGRASVHGGVGESETVRGQGENGRDYDSATSFDSQTTGIEKAAADAESPSSSAANMANKARRAVSKATSARDAAMAAREAAVAAASSASSSYTAAERQALQDAAEAAEQAAAGLCPMCSLSPSVYTMRWDAIPFQRARRAIASHLKRAEKEMVLAMASIQCDFFISLLFFISQMPKRALRQLRQLLPQHQPSKLPKPPQRGAQTRGELNLQRGKSSEGCSSKVSTRQKTSYVHKQYTSLVLTVCLMRMFFSRAPESWLSS